MKTKYLLLLTFLSLIFINFLFGQDCKGKYEEKAVNNFRNNSNVFLETVGDYIICLEEKAKTVKDEYSPSTDTIFSSIIDMHIFRFAYLLYHSRIIEAQQQTEKIENSFNENLDKIQDPFERRNLKNLYELYLGDYYYRLGIYSKAIPYFNLVIKNIKETKQKNLRDSSQLVNSYRFLGVMNSRSGNYQQALILYQEALKWSKSFSNYKSSYNYKFIGDVYFQMGADYYDFSLEYYNKVLDAAYSSLTKFDNSTLGIISRISSTYHSMASVYSSQFRHQTAVKVLNKAVDLQLKYDTSWISHTYSELGKVYLDLGSWTKAEFYLDKSLEEDRKVFGTQHRRIAETLADKGKLYLSMGELNRAMDTIKSATDALPTITQNQSKKEYRSPNNYHNINSLLKVTVVYASIYYEKTKRNPRDLSLVQKLWEVSNYGISIIDKIQSEYIFGEDRQLIVKNYYQLYEQFIWANKQLCQAGKNQYCEKALKAADKIKGILVSEHIRRNRLATFYGPKIEDLAIERSISMDIKKLDGSLEALNKSGLEQAFLDSLDRLREEITGLQTQRQDVLKELKQNHQSYYNAIFGRPDLNISKFQSKILGNKRVMFSFFEGEDEISIFLVSQNGLTIKSITRDEDYSNSLEKMRKYLKNKSLLSTEQLQEFLHASHWLYNKLFKPFNKELISNNPDEIIIVPDGLLSYIPFGLLLPNLPKKQDQYASLEAAKYYLINDFDFRYATSAGILLEKSNIKLDKKPSSLGIFSALYRSLPNLENSSLEAQKILSFSNGKIYRDSNKLKDQFLGLANDFQNLLLVLHAEINDENPAFSKLLFGDNNKNSYLYTYEVYGHQLNADLIFFMSCSMGDGLLKKGEGVKSFASAFNYANVKSMVLSLWNAPDSGTIVKSFFEYFYNGSNKSNALRKAKLDYLKGCIENNDAKAANPYFWAGFIVQGTNDPSFSDSNIWVTFGISLIALLVVVIALYFKLKKNARQNNLE